MIRADRERSRVSHVAGAPVPPSAKVDASWKARLARSYGRFVRSPWSAPVARVGLAAAAVAVFAVIGALAGSKPKTAAIAPPSASMSASASTIAADLPPAPSSSASAPDAPAPSPDAPASPAILPDGRIVLNLATEDDLTKLPHVGPTRARAILALRQRLGGKFRAVSDLLRVKGLGRKTLAKLAPKVVVDAPKEVPRA